MMRLVKNGAPLHTRLEAIDSQSGLVNAIIDSPRGSRCKYKLDEATGYFRLSKMLPLGMYFPYNFGFIPSTRGEDGDALDILVLMDEAAFTGCVIPVRLIGVLEASQKERSGTSLRNDRLIGVVQTPFNQSDLESVHDLDAQCQDEIAFFFVAYNRAGGRKFEPLGYHGPHRAKNLLKSGMQKAA